MMKIREIKTYPTSFPLPKSGGVRLGIGQAVKRDCVMVKVTTESGLVGWGESHHGRAHTAVAKLIETTLSQLVLGMDAADVVGVWARSEDTRLNSSHANISYAVFCLKKKKKDHTRNENANSEGGGGKRG